MLETLQNAIEDIHYLAAVEGKLPPSRPFPQLPDREIQAFVENLRINHPESFELDRICSEPLGFYLVPHLVMLLFCLNSMFCTVYKVLKGRRG